MSNKKNSETFHKVKCAGCGRYEKLVDNRVVQWFCSDCFMGNGNFFRAQSGKELIKPVKLKSGTKVKTVFGKKGIIKGKGYVMNNTTYYIISYDDSIKYVEFIGDYQILQ